MRRCLLAHVVFVAVLLSACASGSDSAGDSGEDPPEPTENLTAKPTFEVAIDEAPPTRLEVRELAAGDGETAEVGDTLTVDYVGKAWSTGEQFDASWDRGSPIVFDVGVGDVIPGWDQGILGEGLADIGPMQVGGRRMLIIPPDLAYGDRGAGGVIAPGETLVFVVDLRAVE